MRGNQTQLESGSGIWLTPFCTKLMLINPVRRNLIFTKGKCRLSSNVMATPSYFAWI